MGYGATCERRPFLDGALEAVQRGTDEAMSAARDADTIICVGQPAVAKWHLD